MPSIHPIYVLSTAGAVFVLACVSVLGLAFQSVKIRGVGPGISGVLFAGLLFSYAGVTLSSSVLNFVQDFGLILFVYTIGLQVGPGFFGSLRQDGLKWNLLTVLVAVLGPILILFSVRYWRIDPQAGVGLFAGATTNTPALGAAQQALSSFFRGRGPSTATALAYAVTYPVGVFGGILSLLLIKRIFRIDVAAEKERFDADQKMGIEPLERLNIRVLNPALDNVPVGALVSAKDAHVIISRLRKKDSETVQIAHEKTTVHVGDIVLAVGRPRDLELLCASIGEKANVDLMATPGPITFRRVLVTHRAFVGKTIRESGLAALYGVRVTRVTRADIEMSAVPHLRLRIGDQLHLVGEDESLSKAAAALGDSIKALNHTNFLPILLGIALGILLGELPFHLPGVPVPLRLGLAGGPLVAAVLLSSRGRLGPFVWTMPRSAITAFQELGIVLFLACVGLKAGEQFFDTVLSRQGLLWAGVGLLVSVGPLVLVGAVGRKFFKMNYLTLAGLLSGSTTAPPSLAFSTNLCQSDGPALAYATVYPLAMLLRILFAQILVVLLIR